MSQDIPGLVETSLNPGILKTNDDEVTISYSVRSSVSSEKYELTDKMECLMTALGGTVTYTGDYPAWEYKKNSTLRELMIEIYKEQYGSEPVIEALHAGVECGIFSGKLPGLDAVSFGPDIKDIHTTSEALSVESVKRTWNYLLEILKRL
jgi:dipeptidase D